MYDKVLLEMLRHIEMVKLPEISLVTLTNTIAVYAILSIIATMAATRMYVCFIG